MTDEEGGGAPSAGTSTSRDAVDKMKRLSSEIYEIIQVKGKASENHPGVTGCSGKDTKTHFSILHPWSFTPASASDLDEAMAALKRELPKHGWEIVEYGPNTSKNKSLTLVADNDKEKASIRIVKMSKSDHPMLSLNVVSGCYKVPDGEEVDHF
ncbi:hypothetical protein [Streptomyces sp. G44]|uniref:hypothetical protein n=1 Tax=Streptomyces sp. G44 TaxID=2807632 RepID=UPI001EF988A9|nr:hypothetical protein [Streptomyces sp. G44]